ncbi:BEL1-like homeodomain protein 1 [Rutidosis leptorrhynchoides]|uniref:BEL1-like homeodomain protein 1 n=1 Tax=Rutidosis leptorrhynchoides TaxID=125765 RepID=UPI003A995607
MASYYNGNSEFQSGDGLQTLVLMNPGYVNYQNAQQQQQTASQHLFGSYAPSLTSSQTQQFVGIPLSGQHDMSAFMPRVQYSHVEMAPATSHEVKRFQQGLSLSLSSQLNGVPTNDDQGTTSGIQSVLLNSKYLKATHELLEEVVNVGKQVIKDSDKSLKIVASSGDGSPMEAGEETGKKRADGAELSTAERQEVQMKKAKLVSMLDEVEQRYRRYHNQMQVVISWFEQAAGIGSAKTYTSLALQTISKQFKCLKDAIMAQIKAASRSLGEDDNFGCGKSEGGSRLKFVDNHLRQQRALQQLGMIQHNAWRPQRGLPERSVSVLRAWLFEHFLHPYPKDSDKQMLAKQTGLTRSQVSNWFINARVRLWKPMVEEMYLEEIKEHEHNGSDENKASRSKQSKDNSSSKNEINLSPENFKRSFNHPPTPPTATKNNFQNPSDFTLINSSQIEGITQFDPKRPRNNETQQNSDVGFMLMGNPTDFMGGLGDYPIGEIGRQFQPPYSGNSVSLTLGLPHCDNLSMSGAHQSFIPNQNIQQSIEFEAMDQQSSSHSAAMYETMNIQNQRRFATQPLPDFVT